MWHEGIGHRIGRLRGRDHSRYLIDHGTVLSRQLTRPPLCDASEKPTLCNLQPNGGSTALVLFFVLWTYLKWKSKSPIARRLPRAACQLGSSIEAQAAAERTCSRAAQRNSISTADASSRAEVATADGQHQNSSIGVRVAAAEDDEMIIAHGSDVRLLSKREAHEVRAVLHNPWLLLYSRTSLTHEIGGRWSPACHCPTLEV